MTGDPRTWFDATAERMLASRAAISDLEVVGDLDVFQRDKRRRVLDWLAARPLQGKRVLEVGCGAGGNLRFLLRHGALVEGADISPRMIEVATKLNKARGVDFPLHVIDGAHLPHADHSFDVVLTVTALQHNHDGPALESLVREISRVLRPGGEAWILEGVHKERTVHRQSVHRHRQEYAAMFTGAGLEARSFASLPSHYPKWMARWQQVSTASRRALLRLGRRDLQTEADFLRRFGDGAHLDSIASRGIFALTRLVDPVLPAPDALGLFVFARPA